MKSDILNLFFSYDFENEINEKMMYRKYAFEYDKVKDYVDMLLSVSQKEYIDYIVENYDVSFLTYSNIVQFSSFDNGTYRFCDVVKAAGNDGYKSAQIGELLLNDGVDRKRGALLKYGENHANLAVEYGLAHEMSNTYFLTCLGYIINDLTPEEKDQLLFRLILRTKFIRRIIYRISTDGVASYKSEASILKESTLLRRRSNFKTEIKFLVEHSDEEVIDWLLKINYDV